MSETCFGKTSLNPETERSKERGEQGGKERREGGEGKRKGGMREAGDSYQPDSQEAVRGEKEIGVQPTTPRGLS